MNGPASHPSQTTDDEQPVVEFVGIEKSFFGVKVLKGVTCGVGAARIVGLVGENGAGKSTLMNLLGGNLRPDAGHLCVRGQPYAPRNPTDARAEGISFVHQELNLFPNLSIAENLHLTAFPLIGQRNSTVQVPLTRAADTLSPSDGERDGVRGQRSIRVTSGGRTILGNTHKPRTNIRLPWINRKLLRSRTVELLRQVGLDHAPDTLVERLPAGERQLVEIAQALGANARVIILDEPTTSLSARECNRLFALMNQLRARGIAMIYISHVLGDVLRLCDDLLVLRDGELVGRGPVRDFTYDRLVSLMVGRQWNQLYPSRTGVFPAPAEPDAQLRSAATAPVPLLDVRSLTQPGIVHDISFNLAAGEVLGISGLMGAGRSELARILFGLDPCASGEVWLAGQRLTGAPRQRIRRGLAFLTEDRRLEGLCMEAAIADNIALVTLPARSRTPARLLDFDGIRGAIHGIREAVRLSAQADDAQAVRTLSGGNQQKVVLAKWLLAEPKVLILDEPTRGIDVGAKFEIYQLIHQLADRGAGVLVISSEIEELIGICDRVLVMRHGEITGEFGRHEFDRERILAAALHAAKA